MILLKNKIVLLALGAVAIAGIALVVVLPKNGATILPQLTNQIGVGTDICAEFPKEWVASVIGKPIVQTKPFSMKGTYSCNYFINETNFAGINADDLSVETQKKGQIQWGNTIKTDPRIPMEHFIIVKPDGLIDSICLVLNPNKFVTVDRFYGKVFDNEGVIAFTIKVAERIQKGENHVAGSASDSNSAPAPTSTPTPTVKTAAPLPQETDVVNSFFRLINEHKPSDAVSMLSANLISDDSQKQAWAVMFNGFESVNVTNIASSMPEDWTANAHTYRVTLDVKMKPESANAAIPYFGYDNGVNTRFITLEKVGNLWKVNGISTGP